MAQEKRKGKTASVRGETYTCTCDSPDLYSGRYWSDGMAKHSWYECRNCGKRGAFGFGVEDELLSTPGFMVKADETE